MDKFASSMVFRTLFFIILYSDISSQPLYENQRQDPIIRNRTDLYYQKANGKPEKKSQYFPFFELLFIVQITEYIFDMSICQ